MRPASWCCCPSCPSAAGVPALQGGDDAAWRRWIDEHRDAEPRIDALAPAAVLWTRPTLKDGRRLNVGCSRSGEASIADHHAKVYLPDEPGFWEASWYAPGPARFRGFDVGGARAGFAICTEMWFLQRAREYGRDGVQLLASPRATGLSSADKWLAGGRAAAVVSGAYSLSSNRSGRDTDDYAWAGLGWIVEPEEGDVLARTRADQPWVTVDLDLGHADRAKQTYPRYVVAPEED